MPLVARLLSYQRYIFVCVVDNRISLLFCMLLARSRFLFGFASLSLKHSVKYLQFSRHLKPLLRQRLDVAYQNLERLLRNIDDYYRAIYTVII